MDGPAHFRKAEEIAAKAAEYLGQGDGQDSAAVWAAVAQVHATLALAAATQNPRPRRAVPTPGRTSPVPTPGRTSPVPQENKRAKPPLPGVGNRLHRPE
jgi:hypothetical protein